MNKVNKSIGWADYSINPVKGKCPMACDYCYARRMYDRFKWNPQPRLEIETMLDLSVVPSGSRVFIGSTFELFHPSTPRKWLEDIFYFVRRAPWAICIFLTKCPENISYWSPFPENCWVGVTATNFKMYGEGLFYLSQIEATCKFISFEPLLKRIQPEPFDPYTSEMMVVDLRNTLNWLIIGQQTPATKKTEPKIEWLREIVEASDKAGIKVFLKDNLNPLFARNGCEEFDRCKSQLFQIIDNFPTRYHLRQEVPGGIARNGYIEK